MNLLNTALTAAAAVELFAAFLLALAFARRPAEPELGLGALLAGAAAAHAIATVVRNDSGLSAGGAEANRLVWLSLVAALPLAVHCAWSYGEVRPPRQALMVGYGIAAAFAIFVLVNHTVDLPVEDGGLEASTGLSSKAAGAVYAAALVAAGTALVSVSRAYLSGRREALGLVVGATILLASIVNDAGVANGIFTTCHLVDGGLAALVVGLAAAPSARYASVARDLELRTRELGTRTSELLRSYEELHTAQEELVKKEQLAVVGELAAVIAHEVRNPLAIIANAVAGLRKQVISREDRGTLLAILDEETSRLNRLVSDLLRYARPVSVQRTHFSLADLLDRALGLASSGPKQIRTELKVECHEGRLWGDANLLRQVFDNLVDNAVQAMSVGGILTVRVHAVTEEGVDGLAVDIIDTGEGMDTQVRSRARDPFFTTRPSGTGLGLAIVDRIVEAHSGRLAIDSRAGEGTTVTVFLPHGSSSEPPSPHRSVTGSTQLPRATNPHR